MWIAESHIAIELSDAAEGHLVKESHDATDGARPLKRTIQWLILDSVALQVPKGKFCNGDTVDADLERGKIVFFKEGKHVKEKAA